MDQSKKENLSKSNNEPPINLNNEMVGAPTGAQDAVQPKGTESGSDPYPDDCEPEDDDQNQEADDEAADPNHPAFSDSNNGVTNLNASSNVGNPKNVLLSSSQSNADQQQMR